MSDGIFKKERASGPTGRLFLQLKSPRYTGDFPVGNFLIARFLFNRREHPRHGQQWLRQLIEQLGGVLFLAEAAPAQRVEHYTSKKNKPPRISR